MGREVVETRERRKLWAFGKNSSTSHWRDLVGWTAGEIRDMTPPDPSLTSNEYTLPHKKIPDCAVFQEDFSFEWIEILLQCHPDTPDMEIIAHAAK